MNSQNPLLNRLRAVLGNFPVNYPPHKTTPPQSNPKPVSRAPARPLGRPRKGTLSWLILNYVKHSNEERFYFRHAWKDFDYEWLFYTRRRLPKRLDYPHRRRVVQRQVEKLIAAGWLIVDQDNILHFNPTPQEIETMHEVYDYDN
jgi:hypothetical protein